ncbi:MAG TPA: iron ABC transporter permease, partial [Phytomonospora sp.]
GPNGQIVIPNLNVFHSIIGTRVGNGISNGENELRVIGQGAGKSLLRIFGQVLNGSPAAPLPVTTTNFGQMAWRYGNNETPDAFATGSQMRADCERRYNTDVGALRRELDVLTVGDDEAAGLGLHPQRSRYLLLAAASLGTAAAVSVAGLIGFVGIIVPHIVRLLTGPSYRSILPLSVLFGGAFLILADLVARVAVAPGELPIGVVTAFAGAPFFVLVMRTTKREAV